MICKGGMLGDYQQNRQHNQVKKDKYKDSGFVFTNTQPIMAQFFFEYQFYGQSGQKEEKEEAGRKPI